MLFCVALLASSSVFSVHDLGDGYVLLNKKPIYVLKEYQHLDRLNHPGICERAQQVAYKTRDNSVFAFLFAMAGQQLLSRTVSQAPLDTKDITISLFAGYYAACAATSVTVGEDARWQAAAAVAISAAGLGMRYWDAQKKSQAQNRPN